MDKEHTLKIAALVQGHLDASPYSVDEVAVLSGFKGPEMLEGIARGDARVPLDKVLLLAQALGCDKRQLLVLVLTSWFGPEFVKTVEEVFIGNSASAAERDWISFLREVYGENVPALTPALRRRLRLLASIRADRGRLSRGPMLASS
ncbi:hypothetical protein [Sinorhizobium medicae]|uniref:hypothetical protein n=1 Tax=Sinorhizobium medicae TaxID=110321 RepID=UPI00067EC9A8|nr:hypothetical protein [Sinorhizobium medicae]MDX0695443.1 hypothetical protein [Sinorhizobium medicae]MDX0744965.1 hypothetical protein [Sinorhizobium medicae]